MFWIGHKYLTSVTNIDVIVEKFIEHCSKRTKKPLEPISNSFKSLKDLCHVIKSYFQHAVKRPFLRQSMKEIIFLFVTEWIRLRPLFSKFK